MADIKILFSILFIVIIVIIIYFYSKREAYQGSSSDSSTTTEPIITITTTEDPTTTIAATEDPIKLDILLKGTLTSIIDSETSYYANIVELSADGKVIYILKRGKYIIEAPIPMTMTDRYISLQKLEAGETTCEFDFGNHLIEVPGEWDGLFDNSQNQIHM